MTFRLYQFVTPKEDMFCTALGVSYDGKNVRVIFDPAIELKAGKVYRVDLDGETGIITELTGADPSSFVTQDADWQQDHAPDFNFTLPKWNDHGD